MEKKKNRRELFMELMDKTMDVAMLRYEDGEFIDAEDNVLGRYQAKHISLQDKVFFEDELIDEVLLFGDGTIEFHDYNSKDAYCWEDYPNEVLSGVVDNIIIN